MFEKEIKGNLIIFFKLFPMLYMPSVFGYI